MRIWANGVDRVAFYPPGWFRYTSGAPAAHFTDSAASWSGTSFATPTLAGLLAKGWLAADGTRALSDVPTTSSRAASRHRQRWEAARSSCDADDGAAPDSRPEDGRPGGDLYTRGRARSRSAPREGHREGTPRRGRPSSTSSAAWCGAWPAASASTPPQPPTSRRRRGSAWSSAPGTSVTRRRSRAGSPRPRRREALRLIRRSQREVADDVTPSTSVDPTADVDQRMDDDVRRRRLVGAFGQLNDACQQLLRLLSADPALPYSVIAETIGRPIGSIGPTRARCLERLRSLCDEDH